MRAGATGKRDGMGKRGWSAAWQGGRSSGRRSDSMPRRLAQRGGWHGTRVGSPDGRGRGAFPGKCIFVKRNGKRRRHGRIDGQNGRGRETGTGGCATIAAGSLRCPGGGRVRQRRRPAGQRDRAQERRRRPISRPGSNPPGQTTIAASGLLSSAVGHPVVTPGVTLTLFPDYGQ